MKWKNHSLMAGSIAIMLNLHPAEIAFCMVGASLPDRLETPFGIRIMKHRTVTHELLLWMIPCLFFMLSKHFGHFLPGIPREFSVIPSWITSSLYRLHISPFSKEQLYQMLIFHTGILFLPGILHLAGDILTPGGILIAGHRVSIGLFRTGELKEYMVAGLFVALAIISKFI